LGSDSSAWATTASVLKIEAALETGNAALVAQVFASD
jgi:hypothetical protein